MSAQEKDHQSELRKFYANYDIALDDLLTEGADESMYLRHRFVRLHPAFDAEETLKQLKVM